MPSQSSASFFLILLLLATDISNAPGVKEQSELLLLVAQTQIHIPSSRVVGYYSLVCLAAAFSSVISPKVQRLLGWSTIRMLAVLLLMGVVIPLDAALGAVLPIGGLRKEWEWVAMKVFFGLVSQVIFCFSGTASIRLHLW